MDDQGSPAGKAVDTPARSGRRNRSSEPTESRASVFRAIRFILPDGERTVTDLDEARSLDLAEAMPIRVLKARHSQPNIPGWHYDPGTRRLLPVESRAENRVLLLHEFAGDVAITATQPCKMTMSWEGSERNYYPDFWQRLRDGSCRLVEVGSIANRPRPERERRARALTAVAAELGWGFLEQDLPADPTQRETNITWLASTRTGVEDPDGYAAALTDACTAPITLAQLLEGVDAATALVLPVLWSLLWLRVLQVDLDAPISLDSIVSLQEVLR